MAEIESGKWIILLLIYFTIFFTIVSAATQAENELSNDLNDENFQSLIGYEECSTPMTKYNPDGTVEEQKYPNDFRCDESIGVNSEEYCNLLQGCAWSEINSTSYLWGLITIGSDYFTCNGEIDWGYYGFNSSDIDTYLSGRNHTDFSYDSNCEYPSIKDNRTACQLFACTWTVFEPELSTKNPIKLMSTIGDVFTFQYDFGVTNSNLQILIYVIFVILPLIALVWALWFTLR